MHPRIVAARTVTRNPGAVCWTRSPSPAAASGGRVTGAGQAGSRRAKPSRSTLGCPAVPFTTILIVCVPEVGQLYA